MSQKIKFRKLHIPRNSRKNEASNSTTVSRYFSQPVQTKHDNEIPITNKTQSQDTKSTASVNEQINFSTINNVDQCDNITETEDPSKNEENLENNTELKTITTRLIKRKTTVQRFFDESSDTDFEISTKQQKKTFSSKISYQQQKNNLKKRKRQPKINNMLLRNELMLSKMLTEQSIAENVNPDEMQLALALSRSEIEVNSFDSTQNATEDSPVNIQKKLRKYEFKSSSRNNDIDNFPLLIFSKSRGKWANKFTPLTLRDSHKQSQKLLENVEKFLNQQEEIQIKNSKMNLNTREEKQNKNLQQSDVILTSNLLTNLKSEENFIFDKCALENLNDIQNYYVTDLFIPSKVKAGHLLRDYRKIPGRDLSPINSNRTDKNDEYNTLTEKMQCDTYSCTSSSNCIVSESSSSNYSTICISSKSQDTSDKNNKNEKGEISREPSPDLFADCDEMHYEGPFKKEENSFENRHIQENNIENEEDTVDVYEKFSSDDDDKKSQSKVDLKRITQNHSNNVEENTKDLKILIELSSKNCDQNEIELSNKKTQIEITENCSKINIIDLTDDCSSDMSIEKDAKSVTEQCVNDDDDDDDKSIFSQKLEFIDTPENNKSSIVIDSDEDDIQNSINRDCTSQREYMNSLKNTANTSSEKFKENYSQNSFTNNDDDDDCIIILSDDEVNYSIRRTKNKIFESNIDNENDLILSNGNSRCSRMNENSYPENSFEQNEEQKIHNFSLLDLISVNNEIDLESDENNDNAEDNDIDLLTLQDQEKIINDEIQSKEINKNESTAENEEDQMEISNQNNQKFNESFFDLKKLKLQFGILDEKLPNKINKEKIAKIAETKVSKIPSSYRKSLSESFSKCSSSISNENKTKSFQQFQRNSEKFKEFIDEDVLDDFDEFDKMVYGSPEKKIEESPKKPEGLNQLLTGEINVTDIKENKSAITEVLCDGKVYLVKTENIPEKPDFQNMDSPKRLKELYKYGLKPLKKKQAIIMLEYIYNQTHPFIENDSIERHENNSNDHNVNEERLNEKQDFSDVENLLDKEKKYNKFQLKNCFGDVLLKEDEISPECNNEEYYFPTNVRSKISTAVLPLHLAWFNLVKSNDTLREALLHYEPIDLQEIYLFFKRLGYRYNPKDMKKFFDNRCIIFRYDLNEGNNNRHVKKFFTKKSKNSIK